MKSKILQVIIALLLLGALSTTVTSYTQPEQIIVTVYCGTPPVANITAVIHYYDHTKRAITNASGVASFNIPPNQERFRVSLYQNHTLIRSLVTRPPYNNPFYISFQICSIALTPPTNQTIITYASSGLSLNITNTNKTTPLYFAGFVNATSTEGASYASFGQPPQSNPDAEICQDGWKVCTIGTVIPANTTLYMQIEATGPLQIRLMTNTSYFCFWYPDPYGPQEFKTCTTMVIA